MLLNKSISFSICVLLFAVTTHADPKATAPVQNKENTDTRFIFELNGGGRFQQQRILDGEMKPAVTGEVTMGVHDVTTKDEDGDKKISLSERDASDYKVKAAGALQTDSSDLTNLEIKGSAIHESGHLIYGLEGGYTRDDLLNQEYGDVVGKLGVSLINNETVKFKLGVDLIPFKLGDLREGRRSLAVGAGANAEIEACGTLDESADAKTKSMHLLCFESVTKALAHQMLMDQGAQTPAPEDKAILFPGRSWQFDQNLALKYRYRVNDAQLRESKGEFFIGPEVNGRFVSGSVDEVDQNVNTTTVNFEQSAGSVGIEAGFSFK